MKHYIKKTVKPETEWEEFKKLFPIEKNRQKFKNLTVKNGKIVNIETDDPKMIKFVKEKGLIINE